jgi:hypothetical protein
MSMIRVSAHNMTASTTAIGAGLFALLIAGAGWCAFVFNSLTAPSRGTDLYDTALSIGALFEVLPAAFASSILVGIAARAAHVTRLVNPFILGCVVAGAQIAALAVAWTILDATA